MNILSFALFGTDEKYRNGIIQNANLAIEIYPDWILLVYCDKYNFYFLRDKIPKNTKLVLQKDKSVGLEGMSWRLLATEIEEAQVILFRDADSLITFREKFAIDEWLASSFDTHLIRDHPYHFSPIMGGMFGVRRESKTVLARLVKEKLNTRRLTNYGDDQAFLSSEFYPKIKFKALVHTNSIRYLFEYAAPLRQLETNERFIGAFSYIGIEEHNSYNQIRESSPPLTLLPIYWKEGYFSKKLFRPFMFKRIKYHCHWCL